jgi:hydroxypyruvate isomerase
MTKLAANLSMMFQDRPFLERFDAAADAGFKGVEYLFPYEAPAEAIRERLDARGLKQVLFNTPAGNWTGGERGLAALPDRIDDFRTGVEQALTYARATGCKQLHVMAGIPSASGDKAEIVETFDANVAFAAQAVAGDWIDIIIEPINTRVDIPGYFLNGTAQAVEILDRLALPNVRLMFDIYHMQIMEGDLARSIERLLPRIGHIQLADNPGRNEPGTGEINYPWLLNHIDGLGYDGWVGCEYRPKGDTAAGLGWAGTYLSDTQTVQARA